MPKYNKLVRDLIPEIIRSKKQNCVTHIANEEEYWQQLLNKLEEEVAEFREDSNEEELADIYEVLDAIITHKKFQKSDISQKQDLKRKNRGSFTQRIILDEAD